MQSVCVFCGSSLGDRAEFSAAAQELAAVLVERKLLVVYGAGSIGLMGVLADQALTLNGSVVGVIPRHLCSAEVLHDELTELHITDDLLGRKQLMMDLSDAFIALPGGLGTLDELLEVYTWAQLGQLDKPIGLLNVCGYFDPFIATIDHAIAHGFVRAEVRDLILVSDNSSDLVDLLVASAASQKI